jgi:hypothetical protein
MSRPIGAKETPQALIRREIRETVKHNARIRALQESLIKRLEAIAKAKPDDVVTLLNIFEALAASTGSTSKSLAELSKHLPNMSDETNEGIISNDITELLNTIKAD